MCEEVWLTAYSVRLQWRLPLLHEQSAEREPVDVPGRWTTGSRQEGSALWSLPS